MEAYDALYDQLYGPANDMFDEEVFAGYDGEALLDKYNNRSDDTIREMLFSIIDEMIGSALDGYEERMRAVLLRSKDQFIQELTNC